MLNCQFITGLAGSGKSTGLKTRLLMDPEAYLLCSTTGLSSINLGVPTLNSALHYFDTQSLLDNYVSGRLYHTLRRLLTGQGCVHGIAVDECSMMPSEQLDILYDVMKKVSMDEDVVGDIELTLVGDFCQLPAVKAKFAFEAKCWDEFDSNTIKLDTVFRQKNMKFLEALNEFRAGNGRNGVDLLKECGVKFNSSLVKFKGTTIVPKNDAVDNYNKALFSQVSNPLIKIPCIRIGKQTSDWNKIPNELEIKTDALVMVLANDTQYHTYANGDQGIVINYDMKSEQVIVKLLASGSERDGKIVRVSRVRRDIKDNVKDPYTGELSSEKAIVGTIQYMPLRLAYASTVHRGQGLSLDSIQIDFRNKFFGNPGMMYVALSRCRTPEGLRLVGSEEMMVKRTVLNPKVRRFL